MPIFILPLPQTMRLLSGHILPRIALNVICSHLDLKKFSLVQSAQNHAYMGGE